MYTIYTHITHKLSYSAPARSAGAVLGTAKMSNPRYCRACNKLLEKMLKENPSGGPQPQFSLCSQCVDKNLFRLSLEVHIESNGYAGIIPHPPPPRT